jgi:hypothetical protein
VPHTEGFLLRHIVDLQRRLLLQRLPKIRDAQRVVLVDGVVVVWILELQRQNSIVGEILPVDAGE